MGNIHFSSSQIRDNAGGVADGLAAICPNVATIPPYTWLSRSPAQREVNLKVKGVQVEGFRVKVQFEETEGMLFWMVYKQVNEKLVRVKRVPITTDEVEVRGGGRYAVAGIDRVTRQVGEVHFFNV